MRVSSTLFALCASPLLALAQTTATGYNNYQNPFKIPAAGLSATAGQPMTINWTPTTSGTISLVLRTGASSNLAAGTIITTGQQNSGSYTWTPPTSITRGSDYAIEIVDDSASYNTNYTPYFVIDSDNTVAYSTADVTLGAPTTSIARATASPTGSAATYFTSGSLAASTSAASSTGVISGSSSLGSSVSSVLSTASAAISSELSSISSSVSAATASTASTGSASSGSASSGSASSGSGSSTLATSTTSGASAASATSGASFPSSTSSAMGSRATAMAGMLGVVALGAMAL